MIIRLNNLLVSLKLWIIRRVLFPRTSIMIGWEINSPVASALSLHNRVVMVDTYVIGIVPCEREGVRLRLQ